MQKKIILTILASVSIRKSGFDIFFSYKSFIPSLNSIR